MKKITFCLAMLVLPACSPTQDMQGWDPREYYTEHPIKYTVEEQNKTVLLHYEMGQARLSSSQIDKLSDSLHAVSVLAVGSIEVGFASADKNNNERKLHLEKLLRNMGYSKGEYVYTSLHTLKSGEVQLTLNYSVAVAPPNCPDWRTSPVTTHSNTQQGNFGCASQANMALMVADPHDLVRGTADMPIDTPTADKAIEDFRSGKGATGSSVSSSGGSSTTGGNAVSATGASQ